MLKPSFISLLTTTRNTFSRYHRSFQGNVLQQNARDGIIMSNMSLVLQGLTRHRSGHYVCRVANSEGEDVSNPIQLSIQREWTGQRRLDVERGCSRGETFVLFVWDSRAGCRVKKNIAPAVDLGKFLGSNTM